MADRTAVNLCKSLFSSRFSSINAKSLRYFTRYLSSRATNLREEESRISFITDGCSVEELENVQDLVDENLEVREDFITEEEESLLLKETEPYLKRQKYQFDHWDDVSFMTVQSLYAPSIADTPKKNTCRHLNDLMVSCNYHFRQSMVTGKQKNRDGVMSLCQYSREFEMRHFGQTWSCYPIFMYWTWIKLGRYCISRQLAL